MEQTIGSLLRDVGELFSEVIEAVGADSRYDRDALLEGLQSHLKSFEQRVREAFPAKQ